MAERMLNAAAILLTPRPPDQIRSICGERDARRVDRGQYLVIPTFEFRRKQVNRSLGNELPQWPFSLAGREKEIKSRVGRQASGGDRSEYLALEKGVKSTHRPVADAVNRGSSAPVLDV